MWDRVLSMPEPPKSQRRLRELVTFFGATDEVAPVNRHVFARKLGHIIARARAVHERYHVDRSEEQSEGPKRKPGSRQGERAPQSR